MKIKLLFFVLGAGFILASCTDKEAEAKMMQMEADMKKADSTCQAGMLMMQTQMDSLQGIIDSMMKAKMTTGTSTKTTTKSEPVKKVDAPVKKKEGTNSGIDIKKKTGSNQGGGK
jgi:hypothetical protein